MEKFIPQNICQQNNKCDAIETGIIKNKPNVFKEYHLEIEERKLIEKRTLRQGDSILSNIPDENGTYNAGTLG